MIHVLPVADPASLDVAFAIRRTVFVEEQNVSAEEEYDEYEATSTHFLAYADGVPCGTARWRRTANGIKLERFAVLSAYRGMGVGKALVRAVLDDVFRQPLRETADHTEQIYMHAQLTAMPLYAGFGFVSVGPMFEEAGILHYKMVLPDSASDTQEKHSATKDQLTKPPQ